MTTCRQPQFRHSWGLIPSQEDGPLEVTDWQHAVFPQVPPHLLARIDDQGLRDQLLAAAGTRRKSAARGGTLWSSFSVRPLCPTTDRLMGLRAVSSAHARTRVHG
ncbi:hypothetical protein GCM10009646_68350 [Streptomyces aureus]